MSRLTRADAARMDAGIAAAVADARRSPVVVCLETPEEDDPATRARALAILRRLLDRGPLTERG